MKNIIMQSMTALLLLLLSKLLIGCDNEMIESGNLKEQMIPVNSGKIYTRTIGKQQPTIVLMTGIGGATTDF